MIGLVIDGKKGKTQTGGSVIFVAPGTLEEDRRDEVRDLGGEKYQVEGYCTATNKDDRTIRSVIGYACTVEQRTSDWLLLELVFP
ncbi:MAG: hypothetical protein QMD04_08780 [Anaerolineales bacterium]|nr:hypothetical protein [Anaerolineales bacterium]